MKYVLGVRLGHDAAACLICNGQVIADVQEERFTRKKNDGSFPVNAIQHCLKIGGISSTDLDAIAVPSVHVHPYYHFFFPNLKPVKTPFSWSIAGVKKQLKKVIKQMKPERDTLPVYMTRFPVSDTCKLVPVQHHLAHAASAYFTSSLARDEKALVVVADGVGDGESVSIWRGQFGKLDKLASWDESGSLGRFYSAATEALGWRHGSGEWKLMGLAPYGKTSPKFFADLHPEFENGELKKPIPFKPIGYFPDRGTWHYHMDEAQVLKDLKGSMSAEDFAAEVQDVVEKESMKLILPWLEREGTDKLCCAGGFFLNVKVNGLLWATGKLKKHWVFPNPGDSGLALGAAMAAFYENEPNAELHPFEHLYLGSSFSAEEIEEALQSRHIKYSKPENLAETVAKLLAGNKIIGWYQGNMETGPRALGNRSILMSPLRAENKDVINASVKYREAFRPFCPSMLDEKKDDYLVNPRYEPYMITAFEVTDAKRDKIPAVVHVDGSLRPQTVRADINPRYHALIKAFGDITGEYVILNTSFNVRGEPIVRTPSEAIKCFYDSGLQYLILGDYIIAKEGE